MSNKISDQVEFDDENEKILARSVIKIIHITEHCYKIDVLNANLY